MSNQDDLIDNDSDLNSGSDEPGDLQPKIDIPNINYLLIMLMTAGNMVLAYTLFKSNIVSFKHIILATIIVELLIILLVRPKKKRKKHSKDDTQ